MPRAKILRTRRRYIAIRIDSEQPINDGQEIFNSMWNTISHILGEYVVSQAELALIEYNPSKQQVIIRCSNRELDSVRAAIVPITHVGGTRIAPNILMVSGTLKALRNKTRSP